MKRLIPLFAALALSAFIGCANQRSLDPVSAQSTTLDKDGFDAQTETVQGFPGGDPALFQVLNLTEEQKTQLKEIVAAHHKEMEAWRAAHAGDLSREDIRAHRQEMRDALRQKIDAILTPEQRAKAAEIREQLQRGEVPEELVDARIAKLSEKLHLTEDQIAQLKALGFGTALPPGMPHHGADRTQRRERREEMRAKEQQLMNILTPEQQSLYAQMKAEHRDKMAERMQERSARRIQHRVAALSKALDLSASQQAQLTEILEKAHEQLRQKMKAERPRDREAFRKLLRENLKEVDKQIQEILTEEQRTKYAELKAKRHGKTKAF
ncbi:MAG: hypothetical protein D6743_01795 [Calditrichaeota bacterium]|nr:MAG: hypothetical protein D6743_01795 [Calditrichota bacterium]